MRSSIILSLLLQSFYAVLVLCTSYHVYSIDPKRCIVGTGGIGEYVKTVPFGHGCHTALNVHAPLIHNVTHGAVSGAGGLYIGINGRPKNGTRLTWVRRPYIWQFNPATFADYHVVSLPGEAPGENGQLFWILDPRNPEPLELVQGPIRNGNLFWNFNKA